MSPTLFFCVPAHGRLHIAEVCFRQLARTCVALTAGGIRASAMVAADDENLEIAAGLGFGTVERENAPLGRKWNDLYEASGLAGVDFVVPFGSDDWIDPAAILAAPLPADDEIRCFLRSSVVREDGRRLARLRVSYGDGRGGLQGDGIRIIPTTLLASCGFRPAEEDRDRAIDSSVWRTLARSAKPRYTYFDLHPLQIVDWKSGDGWQLNSYADCQRFREGPELTDPFEAVAEVFPAGSVDEMREVYRPVSLPKPSVMVAL